MCSSLRTVILMTLAIIAAIQAEPAAFKTRRFGFPKTLPDARTATFNKTSKYETRQYTGNFCESDDDCEAPRSCYTGDAEPCEDQESETCICISLLHFLCDDSSDCLAMDRCYKNEEGTKFCVTCSYSEEMLTEYDPIDAGNCDDAPAATPTKIPSIPPAASMTSLPPKTSPLTSPRICIAANALSDLPGSALVFAAPQRASVLCDKHDSCATPGHVVIFNGSPMSMKDYCKQVGVSCVKRVKLVNSPKMKMGLRIASRSTGLQFTALAATMETRIETTLLTLLVRLGI